MKIVSMIALNRFPFWKRTFDHIYKMSDKVFVRFDGLQGDPAILQELREISEQPNSKLAMVNIVKGKWSCPEWREECLAMVHDEKPDIVIALDEDEKFEDTIEEEMKAFWLSEKKGMMFFYNPLVTKDSSLVNGGFPYPPEAHMKVFKWEAGLSYWPYHGAGVLGKYGNPACHWMAKTKINHYCAYTEGMRLAKRWRSDTPIAKGRKAVTLMGFGPSSEGNLDIAGEVWSLNNCYQVFKPELMKRVTRIYEMHQFHKRDRELAHDGQPHFWHLDQLGQLGHRIIMQAPHPQIANSEAFPLNKVIHDLQFRYFDGTPCYLLAHALLDGFNDIRVYGFDQLDFEHRLQRECFVFWMGVAAGMGCYLGGALTFLKESTRLYGYDYGPEFDDECRKRLYSAWPFEIIMKEPSRAMKGDLFDGKK